MNTEFSTGIAPVESETIDKAALREFMHQEFQHFLTDIEFRVKQAYDVQNRTSVFDGEQVYAEDMNLMLHQITGYTMTPNSPGAGSIAWTAVHIVFGGVDYTCADGSTNLKYVWFVKPGTGTTATLQTSNTKPTLGPNDCLVFVNNGGTPINALTTTIPVALADNAVDSGAIANGAVTAAKTDFYTSLADAIDDAMTAAELAQATADGSITSYFQSAAPWANGTVQDPAKVGDVWYDSDTGEGFRWSGAAGTPANTWVIIRDTNLTKALADAAAAQGTADAKTTTFFANAAATPTALKAGDTWIVLDQGNKMKRASAPGTASWSDVLLGGAAIAGSAIGDTHIASGINGSKLTAGTVSNTQIGSGIDGAKLSSGTVGSTQLGSNAVTPTKINILQHIMF